MMQWDFPPLKLTVGHLHQPEPGECLAACAAMVLTYRKIPTNYHRLFKLLQIQKGYGAPFYNIQALTQLHLDVLYRQGTLHDLYHFLQSGNPVIVPVSTGELPYWPESTDHAVVVVGMDAQSIYLNDPAFATAPIQVGLGDFDLAWLERDEYFAVLAP